MSRMRMCSFSLVSIGLVGLLGLATIPFSKVHADQQQEAELDSTYMLPVIEAEAIVVTGSAVRRSPIDLPYAVARIDRESLAEQGAPSMVDLFKNLSASSGVIGESNSWYNGASAGIPETVANINLRGLGASRSLVLLNGRRQTYVAGRLVGGRFVDVNAFPSISIERMDILKEGAGAVYGSDAIAGVANFITRSNFEGFEADVSYDYFNSAGDMMLGGIWGGKIGESNLVVSLEHKRRNNLRAEERDWALRAFPDWGWGWSWYGNPGAFIVPDGLVTDEAVLSGETRFVDPGCSGLGGYQVGASTCRFRYQPWDSIVEKLQHTRGFAEFNGSFGETDYHLEALYHDARVPEWETTPSFPPIAFYDGVQQVPVDHPGRVAFVEENPTYTNAAGVELDLTGDQPWYFFGRLVGNAGPGRVQSRESRTRRLAGSLTGPIGESSISYDLGISYSDTKGTVRQPAEYAYRKFLAFRGYGGANCGVEAVPDPSSPSGLALGAIPSGVAAGTGNCTYFNPFSNGIQFSAQPDAPYTNSANPNYRADLAHGPELIGWINEKVAVTSEASLLALDGVLNGVIKEGVASYAAGYQLRRVDVSAMPNEPGNLARNPCRIPGDTSCAIQTGSFTFTSGIHPYDASQTTHAVFAELALKYSDWLDTQAALHFEDYGFANSLDPKISMRAQVNDYLALRGTLQTTFRTPSVDDLNTDVVIYTAYVGPTGAWKAIENRGVEDLEPEEAFTYNLGVIVENDAGFEMAVDYWNFDFNNPIGVIPDAALAAAYVDPSTRAAVQDRIYCPGNRNDGSCAPGDMERIRINHINWPGLKTSGIDWHIGGRQVVGNGAVDAHLDGSYTLNYTVEPLIHNDVEIVPEKEAVGFLNATNPLAQPLPPLRMHASVGYHWDAYSAIARGHYIASYENADWWFDTGPAGEDWTKIDPFLTFDMNFQWRIPNAGVVATLSLLNLADAVPPTVNQELAFDSLTHDPKGRRIKLGVTYRFR